MPTNGARPWESLERQSANLFLLGGVMFATAAALTVVAMMTGDVQSNMVLGEAFIALGWIGPLVGLLGLSFELRERSRRLVQAGRVFTVIGLVAFAYLTVASVYAFVQAIEITDIPIPIAVFLPGIIAGSLLAFVCFSAASLRSDAQSRTLGALMLVPSGIFVTNFVVIPAIRGPGPNPPEIGFIITGLLAVAMLAIGYVLRAEHRPVERSETDTGPVAE